MTQEPHCTGCPRFPEAEPVPSRFLLYDQDTRTWAKKPKLITLCGSSRFADIMAVCGWLLERDEEAIVTGLHFLPAWYGGAADHIAEAEGVADRMDALHLKKIELADEIFVVNVDHYLGESSLREVKYAMDLRKPIRWFTDDEIGVHAATILQTALARKSGATWDENL